jgi:ribosomal protein S18 acetylase RimI-like enzyme
MGNPESRVLVAEVQGTVVGYILASYQAPDHFVLSSLFINPHHQGQGIGGALLTAAIADIPERCEVTLEVLEKNQKAQSLYARYGFRVTKRLDKYFFGGRLIEMSKY